MSTRNILIITAILTLIMFGAIGLCSYKIDQAFKKVEKVEKTVNVVVDTGKEQLNLAKDAIKNKKKHRGLLKSFVIEAGKGLKDIKKEIDKYEPK